MSLTRRRPVPSKPSLPRLPSLPGRSPRIEPATQQRVAGQPALDAWGFPVTMLPDLCERARGYLATAYDALRRDKRITPADYGEGTTPELVLFGGLLEYGFTYGGGAERSFETQVSYLGGRRSLPGGTVSDATVLLDGTVIAVYVDSAFHDPTFIWAGRATVESERVLRQTAIARTEIDRVVVVNRIELGFPLERGTNDLVDLEFRHLLSA